MTLSVSQDPYRLSLVVLCNESLQLLCQCAVLLTQLGVAGAVFLDLSLNLTERALKVGGDLLSLQVVLSAPLQSLLLQVRDACEHLKKTKNTHTALQDAVASFTTYEYS